MAGVGSVQNSHAVGNQSYDASNPVGLPTVQATEGNNRAPAVAEPGMSAHVHAHDSEQAARQARTLLPGAQVATGSKIEELHRAVQMLEQQLVQLSTALSMRNESGYDGGRTPVHRKQERQDPSVSSPGKPKVMAKSIHAAYPAAAGAALLIGGVLLLTGGPFALLMGAALAYACYQAAKFSDRVEQPQHPQQRRDHDVHHHQDDDDDDDHDDDVDRRDAPTVMPNRTTMLDGSYRPHPMSSASPGVSLSSSATQSAINAAHLATNTTRLPTDAAHPATDTTHLPIDAAYQMTDAAHPPTGATHPDVGASATPAPATPVVVPHVESG